MAHPPRRDDTADTTPSLLDIYLALAHIGPATGSLAPLPGEAPEETPRLHIAHTAAGEWRIFIRPDVSVAIRRQLAALPPETLFGDYARVAALLAQGEVGGAAQATALGENLWVGRTLLFPDHLTPALERPPHTDVVRLWPDGDH